MKTLLLEIIKDLEERGQAALVNNLEKMLVPKVKKSELIINTVGA